MIDPGCPSTFEKDRRQLSERSRPSCRGADVRPRRRAYGRPFASVTVTGAISSRICPRRSPAAACRCDSTAYSSDASREMPYWRASTSAVSPMIMPLSEQVNPSRYIASTSVKLPHPVPPARIFRVNQVRHAAHRLDAAGDDDLGLAEKDRPRAAVATACMPDAHALLIVWAGTASGSPARRTTCRAGFGPDPAWRPCPISTSPRGRRTTPARSSAALAATAPSSAGWTFRNAPP